MFDVKIQSSIFLLFSTWNICLAHLTSWNSMQMSLLKIKTGEHPQTDDC